MNTKAIWLVLFFIGLGFVASSGPAYAVDLTLTPALETHSGTTVTVPLVAVDRSPALDIVTIVHYKEGFGHKPQHKPGGKAGKPTEATCFGFISKGAKLVATEDLLLDATALALAGSPVLTGVGASEWDSHTATALFGSASLDATANFDAAGSPDGRNELSFGDFPTEGVIAVARVWGVFRGPPSGRSIDQFDILFDTDFTWGDATVTPTVMDFGDIATHEIGHGVGLADVYDDPCIDVTMFGFATAGETKKRTLEPPDITGLQTLYGP